MPPRDRTWNPETDNHPRRAISFNIIADRLDRKLPSWANPTTIHKETFTGTPDSSQPSVHWMENLYERGYDSNTVLGIEKICREEAQRLGFSCVVIRRGPHVKTNRHASDGSVLTAWDEQTGSYTNVTTEDDAHITAYMGWSLDKLAVCGHIYIAWDTKVLFNMRVIKGPEERKVVAEGRGRVVSEYWVI